MAQQVIYTHYWRDVLLTPDIYKLRPWWVRMWYRRRTVELPTATRSTWPPATPAARSARSGPTTTPTQPANSVTTDDPSVWPRYEARSDDDGPYWGQGIVDYQEPDRSSFSFGGGDFGGGGSGGSYSDSGSSSSSGSDDSGSSWSSSDSDSGSSSSYSND